MGIDVSPTPATQLTTHIVRFAEVVEQVRGRQQVDGGDTLVLPHAASHAVEEGLCTCRGTQATHITATTVRGWVVMIAVDAEHWHTDVVIGVTVVDTFTAFNAFDAFFIHHLKRDAPRAHAVAPEDFDDSVQGPLGRFVVMEQIAAKQHEIHLVTPQLSPECRTATNTTVARAQYLLFPGHNECLFQGEEGIFTANRITFLVASVVVGGNENPQHIRIAGTTQCRPLLHSYERHEHTATWT